MKHSEYEILKTLPMSEYDIKRHIRQGVFISEANYFLETLEECDIFDDSEKEQIIKAVNGGTSIFKFDIDVTELDGVKYVLTYSL